MLLVDDRPMDGDIEQIVHAISTTERFRFPVERKKENRL